MTVAGRLSRLEPAAGYKWLQQNGMISNVSSTASRPREVTSSSSRESPWSAGQGQAAHTLCLGWIGDSGESSDPESGTDPAVSNQPDASV